MEKGPKAWTVAMEGDDGIVAVQEQFLRDMESYDLASRLDHADFSKSELLNKLSYTLVDKKQKSFPLSGISGPSTHMCVHFPLSNGPTLTLAVTDSDTYEIRIQLKNLLVTAALLCLIGNKVIRDGSERHFMSRNLSSALDMNHPSEVVLDNISTLLNVFRVVTQKADTSEEQLQILEAIIAPPSNNLRGTQLEQCARAPFGFWALVMSIVPDMYNGEPITGPEGFSKDFLLALQREKVLTTIGPNIRHGGCPSLYPAFRHFDHVNRMGQLFIDWHKALHVKR